MQSTTDNFTPKFRYQSFMEALSVPCPPDDFEGREKEAFRWVFEDMEDERNFVPQYLKNPVRFLEKEDSLKCQALGLSLFDSAINAQKQFLKARKYLRNDASQLGTHLAQGAIEIDFGLSDLQDDKGHFTFHPYENIDLKAHFGIISPL